MWRTQIRRTRRAKYTRWCSRILFVSPRQNPSSSQAMLHRIWMQHHSSSRMTKNPSRHLRRQRETQPLALLPRKTLPRQNYGQSEPPRLMRELRQSVGSIKKILRERSRKRAWFDLQRRLVIRTVPQLKNSSASSRISAIISSLQRFGTLRLLWTRRTRRSFSQSWGALCHFTFRQLRMLARATKAIMRICESTFCPQDRVLVEKTTNLLRTPQLTSCGV